MKRQDYKAAHQQFLVSGKLLEARSPIKQLRASFRENVVLCIMLNRTKEVALGLCPCELYCLVLDQNRRSRQHYFFSLIIQRLLLENYFLHVAI